MSYLDLPRIHFKGQMYANVPTANNDDICDIVEVARVKVNIPSPEGNEQQWLVTNLDSTNEKRRIPAGWNYYGNAGCRFQEVKITSVHWPVSRNWPMGRLVDNPQDDPLVGAAINLKKAVMVDVDPESSLSTQIFCAKLQIKDENDQILCQGRPTPIYSRWHYPFRNLAYIDQRHFARGSAVWQAAIPRIWPDLHDQLEFLTNSQSTALAALQATTESVNGRGLSLRFCTYYFRHQNLLPAELATLLAQGQANPAIGQVVGTIGPWFQGELASATAGRLLIPIRDYPHKNTRYKLGPSLAQINSIRRVVVLDLITTFPEQDDNLNKIENKGEVSIRLVPRNNANTSQAKRLGHIQYSPTQPVPGIPSKANQKRSTAYYGREAYEKTGGLVEIPYSARFDRRIRLDNLLLFFEESSDLILQEEKWSSLTVETDERGIYLNCRPENEPIDTKTITLQVYRRGASPPRWVRLKLEQYVMTDFNQTEEDNTSKPPTPLEPATPDRYVVEYESNSYEADPSRSSEYVWAEYGQVKLTLRPKRPGTCIIRFVPMIRSGSKSPSFDSTYTTSFFVNVRVFPADLHSYDDTDLTSDWFYQKVLYPKVLRFFHLLYPGMDPNHHSAPHQSNERHHPDLSNEQSLRQYADEIKERLLKDIADPDYMPRTRDLSEGNRKLLLRWCDAVSRDDHTFET